MPLRGPLARIERKSAKGFSVMLLTSYGDSLPNFARSCTRFAETWRTYALSFGRKREELKRAEAVLAVRRVRPAACTAIQEAY